MSRRPVVFLDDGGVLSDNPRRGPQWERLIGEYFPPRLGGDPAAWAAANRVVMERLFGDLDDLLGLPFDAFMRAYNRRWLPPMCALAGAATPPDAEIDRLCLEATAWITRRVHAAQPGAPETVRWLHERGYRLFTASAEDSVALDGYLSAMGVRDLFGDRLYGPDLLGPTKSGRAFYDRLFAETGVDPAEALVVDDSPRAVDWARQAGAAALHVGTDLASLADLRTRLA